MISPEIIKRSATAGLLSVATVGAVMAFVPGLGDEDRGADLNRWADPVHVSYESPAEGQDVLRKAPPPRVVKPSAGEATDEARRKNLEARNEAARKALEQLQGAYDEFGPAPKAQEQVDILRRKMREVRRERSEGPCWR